MTASKTILITGGAGFIGSALARRMEAAGAGTIVGVSSVAITVRQWGERDSGRARRGVNPQTKEKITIPETKTPGFTASNSLKSSVLGSQNGTAASADGVRKPRGRRKAG